MSKCGVYIIMHVRTGRFYVGSAKNITTRKYRHLQELSSGYHHNQYLQEAWDRLGSKKFRKVYRFLIIQETESIKEARVAEQKILSDPKLKNKRLNIMKGAMGGDGLSLNPRKKQIVNSIKSSLRKTVLEMSRQERKEKYGRPGKLNGMYGKKRSRRIKRIISKTHKGNQYNKGRIRSIRTRRKISRAASRRTGELNGFYGRHHTKETKKKIREKKLGSIPPNRRKIKIGGTMYDSVTEAADHLNLVPGAVVHRLKSDRPKWKSYKYVG